MGPPAVVGSMVSGNLPGVAAHISVVSGGLALTIAFVIAALPVGATSVDSMISHGLFRRSDSLGSWSDPDPPYVFVV